MRQIPVQSSQGEQQPELEQDSGAMEHTAVIRSEHGSGASRIHQNQRQEPSEVSTAFIGLKKEERAQRIINYFTLRLM